MSFDKPTRNRLAKFVADARRVIADEFTEQFQSLYGISAKGEIAPLDKLGHLDEAGMSTAALLRERIEYLEKTHPDDKDGTKAAVARLAREQAFTILNRLAAIRMAEKRGLIVESVGKGYQSKGFKVFETVAGSALGDTYHRYRRYLFCLFDELAIDLGVLFDRRSPQALLFPREPALLALLDLLHAADLEALWAEDETIGWIYQYYNDPEERKKMRKESAAPRNSRELAVRNQFFTPRYVVEFLTDNTLGRIWYEMTRGQTRLADQCRYLVRRPTEIFLAEGETAPDAKDELGMMNDEKEGSDPLHNSSSNLHNLSQEDLLRAPVHFPHRPLKDPREIRLLDPACGSMHFGLYAFDLFETIYEEAWDNGSCPALQEAYASKEDFIRDVPRLIIEHNIHGIDIDPRATQIAALSLWLRAQKAWQQQKVPAANRPRVRRSNIVCAEPMPGSPEMLEEFVATLKPDLLGELVKTVFDKMQLAGEAGSLLKIEEEIRTAIETARKEWLKQQNDLLTRKDGSQEEFFDTAEQQVIDALRAYAEQADSDSYQRRLFADDAARGFAFIDLCRKRYDAVVMNPPFGLAAKAAKSYFEKAFRQKRLDFAACFISRFATKSSSLAAITTRNIYFLSSYAAWRLENLIDANLTLSAFADLGGGVLDGAMVEAALSVLTDTQSTQTSFFRANTGDEKSTILLNAVQVGKQGTFDDSLRLKDRNIFRKLPTAALSYWADDSIIKLFETFSSFEDKGNEAWVGLQTNDDFQWVRLAWESPIEFLLSGRSKGRKNAWVPYAKGGEYKEYFPDIHLVVQWGDDGSLIKLWKSEQFRLGLITENNSKCWNESKYFERGVTWSQRSQIGLSVRALPEGCVFGIKGPAALTGTNSPHEALCVFNSEIFQFLVSLQMAFGSYDTGVIRRTPYPVIDSFSELIRSASNDLICLSSTASCRDECHRLFNFSGINSETSIEDAFNFNTLSLVDAANRIGEIKAEVESRVRNAYGVDSIPIDVAVPTTEDEDEEDDEAPVIAEEESLRTYACGILSKTLGCAFGRWDIRYATGERQPPELPDPFDSLPVCSPGMLQNDEGLPAEPKDVPADYPLPISWSGILVDDENHPEDIIVRVEDSLKVIWKDRWEAIEQEACGILGVKTLRDYFRRPAAFFADHLSRYSKSRRQAPIYWPLSTKSGSYTLWLYYHRLTDQTLHTCLADFLDPKLRKVQSELDALTGSGGGGTRAGELREFLDELHDLRDEIERVIKLPWKPNLNDGVIITASPLHKLFRLPKWQKDLKACWDKLAKGDYDWAHLAYTIWPSRVEKACEKDRSIAIAHGMEHLCKIEPPKPKKKRGKKAAEEDSEAEEIEMELDD